MLQTRAGKAHRRLPPSRLRSIWFGKALSRKEEALMRVDPDQLNQLLRPTFTPKAKQEAERDGALLARGLNAGPGAATGRVVFNAADAEEWARRGEIVILVRAGDLSRRYSRDARLAGYPDGPRRNDLACRPRRPPDGEGLCRRLRCPRDRLPQPPHDRWRPGHSGGSVPLAGWDGGRSLCRADPDPPVGNPAGDHRQEPCTSAFPGLPGLRGAPRLGR